MASSALKYPGISGYSGYSGSAESHDTLTDMPDVAGTNSDHDVRYVTQLQTLPPTTPTPFQGMFWYDTDAGDTLLYGIKTVTSDYTLISSDDVVLCDGTFTISVPVVANNPGKLYHIKNIGTGTITIDPSGTETIDDGLAAVLDTKYECISIISNGSNWHII